MTELISYQIFLKSCLGLVLMALTLTYIASPLVGLIDHDMELLELGELEDSDTEEKEGEKEKEKEWRESRFQKVQSDWMNKRKNKLNAHLVNRLHLLHYLELSTPPPKVFSS